MDKAVPGMNPSNETPSGLRLQLPQPVPSPSRRTGPPGSRRPALTTRSTHPICSISSRAWVMMLAPVKQTMPAISMEYQRALGGQARPVGGALSGGHQGGQKGEEGARKGTPKQGRRTEMEFSSVMKTLLCQPKKVLEGCSMLPLQQLMTSVSGDCPHWPRWS